MISRKEEINTSQYFEEYNLNTHMWFKIKIYMS